MAMTYYAVCIIANHIIVGHISRELFLNIAVGGNENKTAGELDFSNERMNERFLDFIMPSTNDDISHGRRAPWPIIMTTMTSKAPHILREIVPAASYKSSTSDLSQHNISRKLKIAATLMCTILIKQVGHGLIICQIDELHARAYI